ncbi:AsmA family protein [Agaribacterium haliotis]|uniref:AsmA family protein n=1 Tax=Agaribacterium haliotis TaxID=2013869 RepID=UPI000BB553B1|nr:AsmA family protein [Agaribacterium haliotis]
MKLIGRFFLIFVLTLIILLGAVVVLLFSFDLNRLKPELQQLAAEHGAELRLDGDLSWQLWPHLALKIADSSLYNPEAQQLASIELASLQVAIAPLLKKKIEVEALTLHGLELNYIIDQQGQNNWQTLLTDSSTPAASHSNSSDNKTSGNTALDLSIANIDIQRLKANYEDRQSSDKAGLNLSTLQLRNVGLDGRKMPIDIVASATSSMLQAPLQLQAKGQASYDQQSGHYTLKLEALELLYRQAQANIKLALQQTASALPDLQMELSTASARQWIKAFDAEPSSLKAGVLQHTQLNILASKDFELIEIDGKLDKTTFAGRLATSTTSPKLSSSLALGKFNADDYLLQADDSSSTTEASSDEASETTALPLELLRELDFVSELTMEQLLWREQQITELQVKAEAKQGLIELPVAKFKINGAPASFHALADARGSELSSKLGGELKALQLKALLEEFADFHNIDGSFDLQLQAQTRGKDSHQLSQNLSAHIFGESPELKLSPLNLLQALCQSAARLEGRAVGNTQWPAYTLFDNSRFEAEYAGQQLKLLKLDAGLAELRTEAKGQYSLADGKFDFPIQLRLDKSFAAVDACREVSSKWDNQVLPLRCKGSIDQLGIKSCGLDRSYLQDIAEQRLNKEKEKQIDRVEKELSDEAEKLLKKHLDDDNINKLKQLFR